MSQLVGLVTITGADEGVAKLLSVGKASDAAKASMLTLAAGGAAILAAGLIAIGVKTSEMAGNFQQGINRLRTGGGDIQDTFNSLGNAVKRIAVDSGVATTPLIAAMYQIVSANQRGAQAYDTLAAAAQGAQIEQANVVDVTKILTTLQSNWGLTTFTAAQYMSGLVKAVSEGKLTLEQLSTAMSPILPIAKQMGISFKDVAAAMAVQTNAGLDANRAATGLQAVFVNIENPTSKAAKAMKEYGVNSIAVADEMKKSLPGAFQMLMDAAQKVGPVGSVAFNRAMADMVGGGTRTAKTIDALSQHMKDWTSDVANIGNAMKSHSKDVDGWALAQSGFNIQMDKAKASMEVLGITIGQALLPTLTKIVSAITPIISAFAKWLSDSNNMKTALAIVGGVLAGLAAIFLAVAIPAVIAFVTAMAPVLLIGAGVAVAVALAILAIQHWGQIMDWITGKADQMRIQVAEKHAQMALNADNSTIVMSKKVIANYDKMREGILQKLKETHDPAQRAELLHQLQMVDFAEKGRVQKLQVAEKDRELQLKKLADLHAQMLEAQKWFGARWLDQLGSWIGDQMSKLGTMVRGWMDKLGSLKDQALTKARDIVKGIGDWFAKLPGMLLQAGKDMIQGLINGVTQMAGNLASAIGTTVHNAVGNIPGLGGLLQTTHLFGYAEGGPVLQTGLAMVHKGEYVIPAGGSGGGRGGYSGYQGPQQINLYVDGYRLAGVLMPRVVQQIRINTGVVNL